VSPQVLAEVESLLDMECPHPVTEQDLDEEYALCNNDLVFLTFSGQEAADKFARWLEYAIEIQEQARRPRAPPTKFPPPGSGRRSPEPSASVQRAAALNDLDEIGLLEVSVHEILSEAAELQEIHGGAELNSGFSTAGSCASAEEDAAENWSEDQEEIADECSLEVFEANCSSIGMHDSSEVVEQRTADSIFSRSTCSSSPEQRTANFSSTGSIYTSSSAWGDEMLDLERYLTRSSLLYDGGKGSRAYAEACGLDSITIDDLFVDGGSFNSAEISTIVHSHTDEEQVRRPRAPPTKFPQGGGRSMEPSWCQAASVQREATLKDLDGIELLEVEEQEYPDCATSMQSLYALGSFAFQAEVKHKLPDEVLDDEVCCEEGHIRCAPSFHISCLATGRCLIDV
jgi:hypothetical protein